MVAKDKGLRYSPKVGDVSHKENSTLYNFKTGSEAKAETAGTIWKRATGWQHSIGRKAGGAANFCPRQGVSHEHIPKWICKWRRTLARSLLERPRPEGPSAGLGIRPKKNPSDQASKPSTTRPTEGPSAPAYVTLLLEKPLSGKRSWFAQRLSQPRD
jgi:hypothetical protein